MAIDVHPAATQWIHKWEKNDWKTVNGDNVKNKPDLERLTSACSRLDVKWVTLDIYLVSVVLNYILS